MGQCEDALPSCFGLVVMDEHFDVRSTLSGSEAITRMRAFETLCEGKGRHVRPAAMILCTGNQVDVEKYANCGASDLWGKPIPSFADGTLQAVLKRLLCLHD